MKALDYSVPWGRPGEDVIARKVRARTPGAPRTLAPRAERAPAFSARAVALSVCGLRRRKGPPLVGGSESFIYLFLPESPRLEVCSSRTEPSVEGSPFIGDHDGMRGFL